MKQLIDRLATEHSLNKEEWIELIGGRNTEIDEYIAKKARQVCDRIYGRDIFIRGLIELTNFCRNDCFYCGIRKSNSLVERYRLTSEDVLSCCQQGYALGFRTFVLQGGEDEFFTGERMVKLISSIKSRYPDCAVTLSLGEQSRETYQSYFDAGADRYLLRHETACAAHYKRLHPPSLSLANRFRCLDDLKEIGFQVGCGFMVGSPFQTIENLAEDMLFIKKFEPHMVGIGPFIPHHQTPFAKFSPGDEGLTVFLIAALRLMLPGVLLPATTALATMDPHGREKAVLAGANVVMPNLSPKAVRKKYLLYDNKACTGCEAAEALMELSLKMKKIGFHVTVSRGDYRTENNVEEEENYGTE